ncbi:MAG: GerMN domain-containing protein [Elainella sp. Prado103]|nr:GerMN domain-containing protein [Elainella sp. Prado103]
MRDQDSSVRTIPKGVIAGLAAVVVAVGSGVAWWTWRTAQPQAGSPDGAPAITASPPDITQVPIEQNVQIYWLKSTGDRFELVPSTVAVAASGQPDALLKSAFETMLQDSPNPAEFTSTIPANTELRQISIRPDGVHVDLSEAFTTGGGSASMSGRLGQVIYTATTLDPQAAVWISVGGKPLDVLGGEGLIVDQPMTRSSFDQNFSL